ncbi:MAG: aldose epimerase family protein [Bacteroidota bacterium]
MTNSTITYQKFGEINGQTIYQYTLQNHNGLQVKIITYGATITSILVPDGTGYLKNIACGFDTLAGYFGKAYQDNAPYFGGTIGRYASRIKDGKFSLDGQDYTLAVNNGSNHLHGGLKGFDKRIWQAAIVESEGQQGVEMQLESPHLEEGYPGNVQIKVRFTLDDQNALSIQYMATTDQATPLSLTNHTYFNLSGFENTIENHWAQIEASTILVPDATNVPVDETASVADTPADLREGRILGECLQAMDTGFEHFYTFDKPLDTLTKVATFSDKDSGITLEISTTEPGVLFYTGYFTSNELQRENGDQYGRYRGLCFETSRYPNGPNLAVAPGAITQPEKSYQSQTVYKISQQMEV